MTGSVQFRVHRALRVISEPSVWLPPAFAGGIRMWSHSDTPEPRSACMGRFLGQGRRRGVVCTSERLWSPSFVVALCCAGLSGLSIAPPIPRPSCHHSTTLSQSPAHQHRLTHHFIVHLIAPEPP